MRRAARVLAVLCLQAVILYACACRALLGDPYHGYASREAWLEYETSVRLTVTCFDGNIIYGTGVIISPRHIITAKHVGKCKDHEANKIEARLRNGNLYEVTQDAELVRDGEEIDVVRLIVVGMSSPFRPYGRVSLAHVPVGSFVCSIGGDSPGVFSLKKCGYVGVSGDEAIIASLAPAPGNSGSPVWLDNRIVGIVVSGRWSSGTDPFAYIVPTRIWEKLIPESVVDLGF